MLPIFKLEMGLSWCWSGSGRNALACASWADGAYGGALMEWVRGLRLRRNLRWEIVSRPQGTKGFVLLPNRWGVERTFGWLNRYRPLSKDYEYLTATSEARSHVALINLRVRRLARK